MKRHEQEIDEKLAEQYGELLIKQQRLGYQTLYFHSLIGDRGRYVGRSTRKEYNYSHEEAERILRKSVENEDLKPWEMRPALAAIESVDRLRREIALIQDRIAVLNKEYTGWSRFFLVTSSQGHVHSSMNCTTCYATTTYGWLPHLSGLDPQAAYAEVGPALCSVCFPDADPDFVGKKKVTKAQAEKLAYRS